MSRFTVEHVRASVLYAVAMNWKKGHFSWPDDACAGAPWAYEVHCGWVQDWNAADRLLTAEKFLEGWVANDANILAALERMEARDWENAEHERTWRKENPELAAEYDRDAAKAARCSGCGRSAIDIREVGPYCLQCMRTLVGSRGPCECGLIAVMNHGDHFTDLEGRIHSQEKCRDDGAVKV